MTTHYKFEKGKFIVDDTFKKVGDLAITVYTGSVIILRDTVFNKNTHQYTGKRSNGNLMTIKKSQILCMQGVC